MSLTLVKQNLLKTKNFDLSHFRSDLKSFAEDEEIPRRLRESLTSECQLEVEVIERNPNVFKFTSKKISFQRDNENENWEAALECPENCIHFSNPNLTKNRSEATIIPRSLSVSTNSSSMSLIRQVSSFSIIETTKFERAAFLTITHLVPMLCQSVIIHWTVKSIRCIRGFKVRPFL